MTVTIHKGRHRPNWWFLRFALWRNKTIMRRKIQFSFSCAYDVHSPDQADHNKLFGIGYLFGGHKKDSARFGWRYDNIKGRFVLSAYCYVQGQRVTQDLCEVLANRNYYLALSVENSAYHFTVFHEDNFPIARHSVPFYHKKKWSYYLGPYFGGNMTAPHTMKFEMKKV